MKLNRIALAILLAPIAATVSAGQFTITPKAGYHYFDSKTGDVFGADLEEDVTYGGSIGYRFTKNFSLEANYLETKADFEGTAAEAKSKQYSVDGVYRFNTENRFQPYLLLGAGESHIRPDGSDKYKDTIINGGVGAFVALNNHVNLRGELRAVHNHDESYTDGMALLGLELAMGSFKEPKKEVVVIQEQVPVPVPVVVEQTKTVEAPIVDSDGDGVPDRNDKCPNTPSGALVDSDGCPKVLTETINREVRVLFDTNKSFIKPEYRDEVGEVAKILKQYPGAVVEIEGHTDSSGSRALNDRLSQARADSVADMLVQSFGIDRSRVTTKGYGFDRPIAPNNTADGKAKNRRVISIITGERSSGYKMK